VDVDAAQSGEAGDRFSFLGRGKHEGVAIADRHRDHLTATVDQNRHLAADLGGEGGEGFNQLAGVDLLGGNPAAVESGQRLLLTALQARQISENFIDEKNLLR
jgi:hypothetical protein